MPCSSNHQITVVFVKLCGQINEISFQSQHVKLSHYITATSTVNSHTLTLQSHYPLYWFTLLDYFIIFILGNIASCSFTFSSMDVCVCVSVHVCPHLPLPYLCVVRVSSPSLLVCTCGEPSPIPCLCLLELGRITKNTSHCAEHFDWHMCLGILILPTTQLIRKCSKFTLT